MEQILDIIISTDFFYSILRISTPIIYAALAHSSLRVPA